MPLIVAADRGFPQQRSSNNFCLLHTDDKTMRERVRQGDVDTPRRLSSTMAEFSLLSDSSEQCQTARHLNAQPADSSLVIPISLHTRVKLFQLRRKLLYPFSIIVRFRIAQLSHSTTMSSVFVCLPSIHGGARQLKARPMTAIGSTKW